MSSLVDAHHLDVLHRHLEKVVYLMLNPPPSDIQFIVRRMVVAYVEAVKDLEKKGHGGN